jgi:hypothetical protein
VCYFEGKHNEQGCEVYKQVYQSHSSANATIAKPMPSEVGLTRINATNVISPSKSDLW